MIFFLSGKVLFPHQLSPQFMKIMRLTAILLTVAFLQVHAKSYPQITLSLKNVSVEKVFYEIERQSGYGFLYTKAILADFPTVTIKVRNASVNEVLNECFKDQPMTYTIEDKMIVVTKRGFTNPELAPDPEPVPPVEIRGRVVSSTGEPLSNVSVIVAGTSVGTTTGIDGRFVLTAPDDKGIVLEFSSVGYQSQRVSVGKRTEVNVVLELTVSDLSDVVIVGYGTRRKVNLTGSVA
ncbi:MAG: carboxypeptidase-like regulatory domain-containing protein, partial [Chitinophagaceae bacterium]|nr:carboxypeptidase-like regulatory domain-containing protein [Chitinophagaceae bacterium]